MQHQDRHTLTPSTRKWQKITKRRELKKVIKKKSTYEILCWLLSSLSMKLTRNNREVLGNWVPPRFHNNFWVPNIWADRSTIGLVCKIWWHKICGSNQPMWWSILFIANWYRSTQPTVSGSIPRGVGLCYVRRKLKMSLEESQQAVPASVSVFCSLHWFSDLTSLDDGLIT